MQQHHRADWAPGPFWAWYFSKMACDTRGIGSLCIQTRQRVCTYNSSQKTVWLCLPALQHESCTWLTWWHTPHQRSGYTALHVAQSAPLLVSGVLTVRHLRQVSLIGYKQLSHFQTQKEHVCSGRYSDKSLLVTSWHTTTPNRCNQQTQELVVSELPWNGFASSSCHWCFD